MKGVALHKDVDIKEFLYPLRKRIKLLVVALNPIPYHASLFRELENISGLNVSVAYCDRIGVENYYDPEFKVDVDLSKLRLLKGYHSLFLPNLVRRPFSGFFSRVNPAILSEISTSKYDVILIQGYDNLSCWFAFFAAKLAGVKVIWRGESILKGDENSSFWKKYLKKIILSRFFNACDAVMYSCTGNRDYLKFYGVQESKFFPIPCAVDNDFFQSERKKYLGKEKEIRRELEIGEDDFVISFVARFTSRKRPLDLLKAIKQINHDNILALFVGDGPDRSAMERFSQDHNIKVLFVGFQNQSEISKYYSVADVAVVISEYDPSPKAMNEAMNFELPIIVTDVVGTARDLVKNGENGFIVKVGEIAAIVDKIDYFNKNRAEAKMMGKRSWKIVKDWNFQEDAICIEKAVQFVMNN